MKNSLPPGQKSTDSFPRFGLSKYANRFPSNTDSIQIEIGGDCSGLLDAQTFNDLPRVNQTSDFHCVTTWTKQSLHWSGVKFKDLVDTFISKHTDDLSAFTFVVLKAQDGYKTGMMLEDLLQDDVILADTLNGEKLNIAHGAPVRLVAPAHYGYKNLKHLYRLEFYKEQVAVKQGYLRFMDHPRARVEKEERASGGPGWFFRYLYRPLIPSTVKQFANALEKHQGTTITS